MSTGSVWGKAADTAARSRAARGRAEGTGVCIQTAFFLEKAPAVWQGLGKSSSAAVFSAGLALLRKGRFTGGLKPKGLRAEGRAPCCCLIILVLGGLSSLALRKPSPFVDTPCPF